MSSPTELRSGQLSRAAKAAERANTVSNIIKIAGVLAALAGLAFAATFIIQAGLLAPPPPEDVKSAIKIETPDRISGSKSSYSGLDRNQKPYVINAEKGVQDTQTETLAHLEAITGKFERPTGASLDVTAARGLYDTKSRELNLEGSVVFAEGTRFRASMEKAHVNTEDLNIRSQSPVTVDMQGTLIKADSMEVTDNGSRVLFKGGVKAHFETGSKTTGEGG